MRTIIYLFILMVGISCNNTESKVFIPKETIIDSLNVRKAYEQLCWDMYCIYYQDTFQPMIKEGSHFSEKQKREMIGKTLGELPIQIRQYVVRGDTLILFVAFTYDDSIIHYDDTKQLNHTRIYGAHISIPGDSVIRYKIDSDLFHLLQRDKLAQTAPNLRNEYESSFLDYLKNSAIKKNDLFYRQAILRKVINKE